MSTASPASSVAVSGLSRLYAVRFVFALVWAGVVLAAADDINTFVGTLLVLYPVYDLVAIAMDARLSDSPKHRSVLYFNLVVSAAAAIGLIVATTSGIPAVLRVWGAWAIVSGIAQLVVGLRRRAMGGQLPMIISGAISVLAGASFAAMAGKDNPSLSAVGGYALLGAIFFLVSSVLLRRSSRKA